VVTETSQPLSRRKRSHAPVARSKRVQVRLTPGEYDVLVEAGQRNGGLSAGAFLAAAGQDLAQGRPMRPWTVVAELAAARQQLRRVGVNLNQIAAAVNSEQPLPDNTAAVFEALARATRRIEAAAEDIARSYR